MIKKNIFKTLASLLVFTAIGLGAHSFILAQNNTGGTLVSLNAGGAVDTSTEREILTLLIELRSIKLNTSLFESTAFKALKDFGVTLEQEPVSRKNPFAPIGEEDSETSSDVEADVSNDISVDGGFDDIDDLGDFEI